MPETAPKKPRKPRRNYELEMRALRNYVTIKIEVLSGLRDQNAQLDPALEAKIAELEAIAGRIKE